MARQDEKVVSLKFDNAQFEKNIKQSMNSLDEFDKQCAKVGKDDVSMSGLQKAFKETEITATNAGFHVRDVWLKVSSVLEYQIARRIVNTGKKIADALTMEGIRDGLSEYEMQMNSVQTIMANTGANVQTVNKYLDELNEYADKTIYNFSQMTRNIGLFTAAGVGLKESTNAIKGIANLAAVSGSDATKASMAMYQLSQALATGTVRLQDWNSVVNAGMGGKVFQNALIRTSELMGTGAKEAIAQYGSFRDSLTKGAWLTSEVLSETLAQIAGAYSEAELIEKGYTAEQVQDIMELAKVAEGAATNVKTFTQLIDTTKEAIGSGWALSFRTIVGDFEEAKDLWTGVSKVINAIIDKSSDERNAMLQSWKDMGGRRDIINTFINLYNALNRVIIPIKEAWHDIFGWRSGALQLKSITKAIESFTDKLKLSGHQMLQVRKIFTAIFSTAQTVINVFKSLALSILHVFTPLLPAGSSVLDILGSIADVIININDAIAKSGIINRIGSTLGKGIILIAKLLGGLLLTAIKIIDTALKLPIVQGVINVIAGVLLKITGYINNVINAILSGKNVLDALNLEGFVDILGKILYYIGLIGGSIAGSVIKGINAIKSAIKGFFGSDVKVDTIEKKFEPVLGGKNSSVVQEVTKMVSAIKEQENIFEVIGSGLVAIFHIIKNAASSLFTYLNSIDWKAVFGDVDWNGVLDTLFRLIKYGASLFIVIKMASGIIQLANALENLSDILENTARGVTISNIRNLATAIFLLAAALTMLSTVSWQNLGKAAVGIIGLMTAFYAFARLMNGLDITMAVPKVSATLLAISAATIMLTGALAILSSIDSDSLGNGIVGLFATLTMLVGSYAALSVLIKTLSPNFKGVISFFIGLGFALLELAGAIAIFAIMPVEVFVLGYIRLWEVLGLIISQLLLIETFMKQFTSMAGIAATIMAFASSLLIIIGAIMVLANMDPETFRKGLMKVALVMGAVILGIADIYFVMMGLSKVLNSTLNFDSIKISASLLAFGAAVMMVSAAINTLTKVKSTNKLKVAAAIVAGIVVTMSAILTVLSQLHFGPFDAAANNMVKIAVSMGILALGINLIVPAILILAALNEIDMTAAIAATGELFALMIGIAAIVGRLNAGTSPIKTSQLIGLALVVTAIGGVVAALMYMMNMVGDTTKLAVMLGGLILIIGSMALLSKASSKISENAGAGLLGLALAIAALMGPLYIMKDMAWEQIAAGLGGMALALIAFARALAILSASGGGLKEAAVIMTMSIALLMLSVTLRALEGIKWADIWQGLLGLGVALAILLAAGAISGIPLVAAGLVALTAAIVGILVPVTLFIAAISLLNITLSALVLTVAEYGPLMNEALLGFFEVIITNAPLAGLAFAQFAADVALGLVEIAAAALLAGPLIISGLVAGITSGIPTARNSMESLDNAMIDQFTSDWAIASPSGLMAMFGGYIVSGLVSGINSGDATGAMTDLSSGMENTFRDYWGIHSDSDLMIKLGNYIVSGLASGIADKAGDAVLEATILGGDVRDGVEAGGVNWFEGYNLGAVFGDGTLKGIQDTLAKYGLSLDMFTGSSTSAQLEQAQTRQAEIAKENKDAWNEYKEAMEAYGEGSVAADMAKQNWIDTVDANAEENRQLTETIKNLETQIEEEETLAAKKEEQAALDAEIAKQTSYLTDTEVAQLSVEDQMSVQRLRAHKASLEQRKEQARQELELAKIQYQNHQITLDQVNEKQKAYDSLQDSIETVDKAIEGYLGTEEEAIDANEELADSMDGVGGSAKGAAKDVEELTDSIQTLLDEYSEKWVSLRDEIFGNFNPFEAVEMDTNEVGSVDEMLKNFKTQIDRNASWGAVQESFYNRLEAIGAAVGNEAGADLAQDWLEGLSADSTEEIRALVNASDEELASFIQMWSDAYGQAGHLANIGLLKTKEDTEEKLAEMLDVVSIRLEDVVNVFDGTVESIAALQELANNDWYQKIINNVPLVSDDIQSALEEGWSLEQLVAFGDGAVDNVNQALLSAVENQQDALTETGSELGGAMLEGVAQEFEEGSKSLVTAEENMVSALADPKDGALLSLKEGLEIGSPSQLWAREIGWWLFMGIMQGLWNIEDPTEHEEEAAKCMAAMLAYIKEWVNTIGITSLHETGAQMTEYLIDSVGGMQSGVPVEHLKQAMDYLSDTACNELEDKVSDWYQVGVDLVQGLIDGMLFMEEALGNTAKKLGETATGSVMEVTDENSPSKVWAQIGSFLVEGLIIGMESQETHLEESVEGLAERANETAEMIAYTLAAAMTDSDYEPTITPVVDLSEIQNGAYLANKMWNNSPASNLSSIVRNNEMETRKAAQYNADSEMGDDSTSGGINFIQNNYSPKALSRLDIYRQTRNQISQLKGALQR